MTDLRLARVGRLAALARGLEREGGYNGAKLVRAALEREIVRYAEAEAPSGRAALADAVEGLRRELAGEYPTAYLAGLDAAAAAARDGRTLPLDEAPATRTCRVCGELFVGEDVPATCPTCESPALSFKEHLPVWYLEPAEPGTVLAALHAGPSRVAHALDGRDAETLATPPASGEWSVREALEHLLFAEQLLSERVARLLSEDDPDLVARAVWAETPTSDEGSVQSGDSAPVLFDRYRELRHRTVERLRDLDEAHWGRPGRHPEWGRVTVLSQAAYFARHEASHLAQVVAAADGRVPGRAS